MNAIISFDETGNGTGIYTDAIPLHAIGALDIQRASTIEFNPAAQLWEVRFTGSEEVVFAHTSRAECVRWEIETLQATL